MLLLVHGKLWPGTRRTLGRPLKLLGDGGSRLHEVLNDGEVAGVALRAGAQWGNVMSHMGMIHKVEPVMNRAEGYEYLLALCRNKIPKSETQDLLVQ